MAAPEPSNHSPSLSVAGALADALEWWREAGLEDDFSDTPRRWLDADAKIAEPPDPARQRAEQDTPSPPRRRKAAKQAAAQLPPFGGDKAQWPSELSAFDAWWMEDASLGSARHRLAARGPVQAELMILVSQPEMDDRDQLLSGPAGRLVASMLRAMGIAAHNARIAAALPAHEPAPDWAALGKAGAGKLALHHIAIARPQRVLLMGQAALGMLDLANGSQTGTLEFDSARVPWLAARDPLTLLASPRARASLWRRWLAWSA